MMDAHTLHLLGLAVEKTIAAGGRLEIKHVAIGATGFYVANALGTRNGGEGITLADALAALLTDLGVTVPERPGADDISHHVERILSTPSSYHGSATASLALSRLCDLYAREPLTAIALLEDGVS